MASLTDIIGAIKDIAGQAQEISREVSAISLPTITAGAPAPAEIEMTSEGDPADGPELPATPKMYWYLGGAALLVMLYLVLKK